MTLVIPLYWLCALLLACYSAAQAHMLILWRRSRQSPPKPKALTEPAPALTVQLPLFNEAAVVEALIDSASALRWSGPLEIQVLDDSTDETTQLAAARVEHHRAQGVDISLLRRPDREGYKAGALAWGMARSQAEIFAIFDADFRPDPGFLEDIAPYLTAGVGFCQARWAYNNRDENIFTKVLSFHMDHHFTVEQAARASALWMGFNGTAGVWRRACIDDAGGWTADTLTEDLDLALRAQLNGWKGRYVDHLSVVSEVPATISAIRTQQHRWMKGGGQVAAKLLPTIWRSDAPPAVKLHATSQLLGGLLFMVVIALLLATPFLVAIAPNAQNLAIALGPPAIAMQLSLMTLMIGYLCSAVHRAGKAGGRRWLVCMPGLLSLSAGLAIHNSLATIDGLRSRPSPFLRTPKKGSAKRASEIAPPPRHVVLELAMALWCLGTLLWATLQGNAIAAAFSGLQSLGFIAITAGSITPWVSQLARVRVSARRAVTGHSPTRSPRD